MINKEIHKATESELKDIFREHDYSLITFDEAVKLKKSNDYKERFIGEYWITKLDYIKLHDMLVKYDAKTLDFTPTTPIEILRARNSTQGKSLYLMEVEAQIEHIDLMKGIY